MKAPRNKSSPRTDPTHATSNRMVSCGRSWRGFALSIISVLVTAGMGCRAIAPTQDIDSAVHSRDDLAVSEQQIRLRMRALVEPLSGAIVASADRIIAETTDRAVQRMALVWKIEAVPALREALFRTNPFVAIMDTWVLMWQMVDYFESSRGEESLSDVVPLAAGTCRQLAAELETVVASMTVSKDVSKAATFARNWARSHPIRHSIASRESTLSRVTERELKETFSMQEVAGNVALTLDDLARRLDVYGSQLFDQARWQTELVALDLAAEYELEKTVSLARTAARSAADAAATVMRLEPAVAATLTVVKAVPELIVRERGEAIEAAHKQVSRTIEFIHSERDATLEYVTKERQAALTELRQTIASEHELLSADAEEIGRKVADHAMLRAAQITAVALVLVFVGCVLLLLIARRIFVASHGGSGANET